MKDVGGASFAGSSPRRRFLVGSGRPSMLMLVRSAAALATMRPVLLLRVLKKAARREVNRNVCVVYVIAVNVTCPFQGNVSALYRNRFREATD